MSGFLVASLHYRLFIDKHPAYVPTLRDGTLHYNTAAINKMLLAVQ